MMTNMQTLKGDKCKARRVREGKGGSLSRKSLASLPVLLFESLAFTRSNRIQFSFLSIQLSESDEKQCSDHTRGDPKRSENPNGLILPAHRRKDESQRGRNGVLELSESGDETFIYFGAYRGEIGKMGEGEHKVSEWCSLITENRMNFRADRPGAYLGEGKPEGSDRREDFSDTQQNVGSADNPDTYGRRVGVPSHIQACYVSTGKCQRQISRSFERNDNVPLG